MTLSPVASQVRVTVSPGSIRVGATVKARICGLIAVSVGVGTGGGIVFRITVGMGLGEGLACGITVGVWVGAGVREGVGRI
jgi:hypothetical protein